jgi:bacterioferritin-associated ferredoxin
MVVCVCNAIREREVREAARAGACDPCGAYATLGCRPKCGKCLPFARALMDEERVAAA